MRTFTHVFTTWLYAHILHAVLFTLFDFINTDHLEVAYFVAALLIGPLISIPALLLCWFLFQFLYYSRPSSTSALLLWLFGVTIALIGNLFLFMLFEPFELSEGLQFITPALVSSWIIILLRKNQLYSFFTTTEIENETHMIEL